VHQDPVAGQVHQVGGDQREHHGARVGYGLQVAAKRGVEQQWRRAPGERLQVGTRRRQNAWIDAPVPHQGGAGPDRRRHGQREQQAEVDPVGQVAAALLRLAGSMGRGDQSIQPEQESHAEDDHGEEDDPADADRAERLGADPADHQRVHHAHGHPAQFSQDHRDREGQGLPELEAQDAGYCGKCHGSEQDSRPGCPGARIRWLAGAIPRQRTPFWSFFSVQVDICWESR